MNKTALIFNPAAGRASKKSIDFSVRFLKEKGLEPFLFETKKKFDAVTISQNCLKDNFETIIVAGGDGTINEAIQPLIFSERRIGILPFGTANVLAREIGVPLSLKKALKLLTDGKEKKVSAGKVTFLEKEESRYFLLMAGVGFDAEVVFSNNETAKKNFGRFSYLMTAAKTFLKFSSEQLDFTAEGEQFSGYSALISNSSHYGGNFKIAKAASIFEPELHLIIIENDSAFDILRVALSALFKSHPAFDGLQFRITKKIKIKGNAKIQLDGDFAGTSPCIIEAIPNALTFIC
jgi:YegS/Rv2252/BmrU family lipid kinase